MKEPESYTISRIAEKLGVTPSTLRLNWTPEFADHLSEGANPPKGKTRIFSQDDLSVLETVAVLRQQDRPYDDIRSQLADGVRLEFERPPAATEAPQDGGNDTAVVTRLAATVARFEGELNAVTGERDYLRERLESEAAARLAAEIRAARAETELDVIKQQRDEKAPRRSFWQRVRGE